MTNNASSLHVVKLLWIAIIASSFIVLAVAQQQQQQRVESAEDITSNDESHETQQRQDTGKQRPRRITLLGLDDILQLEKSGIVGLGGDNIEYEELHHTDMIDDGFYSSFVPDPSCIDDSDDSDGEQQKKKKGGDGRDCWSPPDSTVETEYVQVWDDEDEEEGTTDADESDKNKAGLETLSWGYGGNDPDEEIDDSEETKLDGDDRNSQECSVSNDIDDDNGEQLDKDDGNKASDEQCKAAPSSPDSSKEDLEEEAKDEKSKASSNNKKKKDKKSKTILVDKHWGSDENILKMRDRLRKEQNSQNNNNHNNNGNKDDNHGNSNKRPPVFLLPGLASTRLVSWKHKPCKQLSPLLSDIKMLDHVWLNMNLLIQMATIDVRCWSECMTLCRYQSDYDEAILGGAAVTRSRKRDNATTVAAAENSDIRDGGKDKQEGGINEEEEEEETAASKATSTTAIPSHGCKLRPDEGLDSISSLAPGSISSNLLVGGTNTVYAWLIQWLADNLGYDVTSIVALPYDWRLSPDKMESRDGFLTLMRKKIEAAVKSNGLPGIMVAHSMGNSVFRYFLEWLRVQMQDEAYERYVEQAEHAIATAAAASHHRGPFWRGRALYRGLMNLPGGIGGRGNNNTADDHEMLEESFAREFEPDKMDDKFDQSKGDEASSTETDPSVKKYPKLWELAKIEGDSEWIDWLGKHVWTYVGLAAPLLGAPGPLRSVLSGENMGLPFTDEEARILELSFGSTTTVHPIPTKMGFCDDPGSSKPRGHKSSKSRKEQNRNLACLDELVSGIEARANETYNPWQDYPALRLLLKDRVDYESSFPMIRVQREFCDENEKSPCGNLTNVDFSAQDVMNGNIFDQFSQIWNEENDPLGVKLEQFRDSWLKGNVPNMLESTPDRPHIKHVIMAYGTDVPTEAGYIYKKTDRKTSVGNNSTSSLDKTDEELFDGVPEMHKVIWEEKHGRIIEESIPEPSTFTESILRKKKQTRRLLNDGKDSSLWLHHSGDGTIPYISLMWAHTWLLHATRAMRSTNHTMPMLEGERISNPNNALDSIKVSHRPQGGSDWIEGYGADQPNYDFESRANIGDTGTSHPHGTKYKPKMVRFQSEGKSRSTGMEYTTTVIEAIGVEHKETTRNYDILAAAFTDVLKNLNEDYGLV